MYCLKRRRKSWEMANVQGIDKQNLIDWTLIGKGMIQNSPNYSENLGKYVQGMWFDNTKLLKSLNWNFSFLSSEFYSLMSETFLLQTAQSLQIFSLSLCPKPKAKKEKKKNKGKERKGKCWRKKMSSPSKRREMDLMKLLII